MELYSFYMTNDPHFFLVITAFTGILSCITTAWWGAVSLTNHDIQLDELTKAITVFRSTWPDKRHGNICHGPNSY